MGNSASFEIFLVTAPGLEAVLCEEAKSKGFSGARLTDGGVAFMGGWTEVRRANLVLRGAVRVLARIGEFRAPHLAQLDRRARSFPWTEYLRRDVPVRVEASCRRSRIYHSGAAAERIAKAITAELGAPISDEAELIIKARIDNDLCTLSVDTSGESLHKRGHKEAIAKAPMRETMASLFLRQCGFTGNEPLLDPMCGSGTFVIEAAEMAAGLNPGRARSFAFELMANHDNAAWIRMRDAPGVTTPAFKFHGSDRDAGAIRMSRANAKRAGVEAFTVFEARAVSEVTPPEGPPGLVIVNPPYGTRIGDKRQLLALHAALGKTLLTRFKGWRVGLITSDKSLAQATGLPFAQQSGPISHGGLKVNLFQTGVLR